MQKGNSPNGDSGLVLIPQVLMKSAKKAGMANNRHSMILT
jgi:hypothetical protein